MRLPGPKRTLRFALFCLALEAGGALVEPAALWTTSLSATVAVSSPADAQSSGGYSRPGGGRSSGGYGGSVRRRSTGGGYARPSTSSFGAYRGGDLAISRRSKKNASRPGRYSRCNAAAMVPN